MRNSDGRPRYRKWGALEVAFPTTFYDANIGVDAILSYDWLRQRDVDVRCRRHGLEVNRAQGSLWVPGLVNAVPRKLMPGGVNGIAGRPPYCAETGETRKPSES